MGTSHRNGATIVQSQAIERIASLDEWRGRRRWPRTIRRECKYGDGLAGRGQHFHRGFAFGYRIVDARTRRNAATPRQKYPVQPLTIRRDLMRERLPGRDGEYPLVPTQAERRRRQR